MSSAIYRFRKVKIEKIAFYIKKRNMQVSKGNKEASYVDVYLLYLINKSFNRKLIYFSVCFIVKIQVKKNSLILFQIWQDLIIKGPKKRSF